MNSNLEILDRQRSWFHEGHTRPIPFRKESLARLLSTIEMMEGEILDALKEDLNKSPFEAYATEVGLVKEEIRYLRRKLRGLSRPKRVRTPLAHFPSKSRVYQEPYGSVLIISPWNYPFQLSLIPLIGAIAAGNTVILKPSAYARATSSLLERLLRSCFSTEHVAVVQGGREVNQDLLSLRFDHIFFTGSTAVGRVVMRSAAEHLIPVTLELGGKSPCIVDESADIVLAARRIMWGKLLNAGQTCVAPDYILCHESKVKQLLACLKSAAEGFFSPSPLENPDYPKIINERQFERLSSILERSQVYYGGKTDSDRLLISPALIYPASWESESMQDELFGPLLPILTYSDLDEVIETLQVRNKPLALYLFTTSGSVKKRVLGSLGFGGGCVNDTVVHLATSKMPFGGVGHSGMGSYHGKESFRTFSHQKSILEKSRLIDVPLRYAPYSKGLGLLKLFLG